MSCTTFLNKVGKLKVKLPTDPMTNLCYIFFPILSPQCYTKIPVGDLSTAKHLGMGCIDFVIAVQKKTLFKSQFTGFLSSLCHACTAV